MINMYKYNGGWIETITGPMFAGKTEELIRRITRADIADQNILVFKPKIDNRYKNDKIVSHNGNEIKSYVVDNTQDILSFIGKPYNKYDVIAIDEIQFIKGDNITDLLNTLANNRIRVITTGLDMDFRGEPFSNMPEVITVSEKVDKLTAICNKCGNVATRTQRIVDGEPASYSDPTVIVGASESYEARCRKCHEVKGE